MTKREKIPDSNTLAEEVKAGITSEVEKPLHLSDCKFVRTGSTLLDLALCERLGGYPLGTVVHIIGDSTSGKSLLALSMMAEATQDSFFDNYNLIYDEPEAAMKFPLKRMFGPKISRVKFIPEDRTVPRTVQDWHQDLYSTYNPIVKPYLYVTDSFDALASADDLSDDRPEKGGYRTEKPIVASLTFPKIVGRIEESKSLLIWISQTRIKFGVSFGNPKTFAGGEAIKFYRSFEIWLHNIGKITKLVRGRPRDIGHWVEAKVQKNKFTGKVRSVKFPIYDAYGVDDIRSMIQWMVDEKFWGKPTTQTISTEGDFIDGKMDTIVSYIENNGEEQKLREIVAECWLELEGEILSERKPKYGQEDDHP